MPSIISKIWASIVLIGLAGLLGSCGQNDAELSQDQRLGVFVSVLPQAYFAERIGGKFVSVGVLVGPGRDPHTFEPTAEQMARLARARIYFRLEMPFEDTLCTRLASINVNLLIVDTLKEIQGQVPQAYHENHQDHGDHHTGEGEIDPHVWLSPRLAKVLARTMCEHMCKADPGNEQSYRNNLQQLQADLTRLDEKIATALEPLRGRTFYVFHPAFGHFAQAYGLKQRAVEAGGKSPTAKDIKTLIDQAQAEGVKIIFVQPQFSQTAAKTIASQIGGVVVPIDPLAKNYISNLQDMAEKIQAALR